MPSPEERDSIVWSLISGYTRTEIDALWDELYPDLLEHKPEDLGLKKQGIADFLLAPRLIPFPAGVDVPDD